MYTSAWYVYKCDMYTIFAWELNFLFKSQPILNLKSQNQTKNIPVVLPSYPIKIWGKSILEFLSYDLTNQQTNRDYNFIYI